MGPLRLMEVTPIQDGSPSALASLHSMDECDEDEVLDPGLIEQAVDQLSDLPVSQPSLLDRAKTASVLERFSSLDASNLETLLSGGLDRFFAKLRVTWRRNNFSFPTPEIHFKNLSYSVWVRSKDKGSQSNRMALPWQTLRKEERKILHPMSGTIPPASMTLILASPGAGKSSLLKALSGKLGTRTGRVLKGEVTYSGYRGDEIDVSKLVGLMDQTDCHFPTLTVRETITFADRCLNGQPKSGAANLRQVAELRTDLCLHILGLRHCADTYVGDALFRGVSGGERKRVTVGEMLVGGQSVFFCDEISTGLDSAATYDITKSLRSWTRVLGGSAVVALLQPPPEVVDLFDDIIVLMEGRLVYHGPRINLLPYLTQMGFNCPENVDLADFVIDITSGRGAAYVNQSGLKPPKRAHKFEEYFLASTNYQNAPRSVHHKLNQKMEIDSNLASKRDGLPKKTHSSPFSSSFYQSTKLVLQRQRKIWLRDRNLVVGKIVESILVGLLLGIIFYKVNDRQYLRVIFFIVAIFQRQAWQQLTITLQNRNIFYKQRLRNFYRTLSYTLAEAMTQAPLNICVSVLLIVIVYFMIDFARSARAFFVFYAIIVSFQHAIAAYFSMLACFSPSVTIAQGLASFSVSFFLLFSGNIILPDLIPSYWRWVYWFNPLAWALRSALVNEFHDERYTLAQRETALRRVQISKGPEYIWIGIGVLLGYYVIFTLLSTAALHWIRYETTVTTEATAVEEDYYSYREPEANLTQTNENEKDIALSVNEGHPRELIKSSGVSCVPAYLCVDKLNYHVDDPANNKEIHLLHDISAFFTPYTMTALMGASGAGKTTFMDVLAGRKTGGKITGNIIVNGELKDPSTFSRIAGYCEQMDIHSPAATVLESLRFSAMLRLASDTTESARDAIVQETMDLLELTSISNALIRTCSLEQKKRVTIGVEVVANPSILFLDEPTSGLDARSASTVMKGVLSIAHTGRTVLCTIHQPSFQLFELFDALLLLQKGGKIAYFGDLGSDCSKLLTYFQSIPGTPSIRPRCNPATYMLEVIGAGIARGQARDYSEEYGKSALWQQNQLINKKLSAGQLDDETVQFLVKRDKDTVSTMQELLQDDQKDMIKFSTLHLTPIASSFYNQCSLCARKMRLTYWRNPQYNLMRMIAFPIYAAIFGSTFFNLKINSIAAVNSHVGLMYNTLDFIGVTNLMTVLDIVVSERVVYYRERMSNYYDPLPYSLSLMMAEVPYLILTALLFMNVEYWMTGWTQSAGAFFLFSSVFLLHISIKTSIGQLMGLMLSNIKVANVAVGALSVIFNLFSGFLMLHPMMEPFYSWIRWLVPTNYSLSTLVSIEMGQCRDATDHGCSILRTPDGLRTTQAYIVTTYGFLYSNISRNIGLLILMWLLLQIGIYLTLRFVSNLKR
uniref:ATPbinding Cassette (ABC) Superfamily putative n=1 Tax=Albugo laibachii Nc14 TaxID=890382 RepID=F0WD84_9STRA|nr:ATPbinding Cassette (ABC) Superfamily putative [Albugo laibachii Nc14]|eukprot:CCA19156.1 ATPbinding Cassette (ABC) Superfamily putative [Albugo laibachii Nc14]